MSCHSQREKRHNCSRLGTSGILRSLTCTRVFVAADEAIVQAWYRATKKHRVAKLDSASNADDSANVDSGGDDSFLTKIMWLVFNNLQVPTETTEAGPRETQRA